MSNYHQNPKIHEVMLVIINDGNGDQCGFCYDERREWAFGSTVNIVKSRMAVRNACIWDRQHGGHLLLDRPEIIEAACALRDYYTEEAKQ